MVGFAINVEAAGVKRLLTKIEKRVQDAAFTETRRAGDEFLRRMRDRARGGEGSGLRVRTGMLRQSFGKVLTRTDNKVTLECFSAGVAYASLHEYGGIIRPKPPRKYLTIPMPDNLTKAGVPRFASARDFMAQYGRDVVGKGAKEYAFVFTSKKSGKKFIAMRRADGKTVLLWRLVKEVFVPGRLRWNLAFNEMSFGIPDRIAAAVDKIVREENAK